MDQNSNRNLMDFLSNFGPILLINMHSPIYESRMKEILFAMDDLNNSLLKTVFFIGTTTLKTNLVI
jgi:hypothetical protein